MTAQTIKIKELIKEQVDMGTFGLVELELLELEKQRNTLLIKLGELTGFEKKEIENMSEKDKAEFINNII